MWKRPAFQRNGSSFAGAWKTREKTHKHMLTLCSHHCLDLYIKRLHIFFFLLLLSRLREGLIPPVYSFWYLIFFLVRKGVWGLLGPLKSLCRGLAKLNKKEPWSIHTGPFLRPSQRWLGGVLLVYERENRLSLLQKWNGIKAFVQPTMVRGISNSCRHLEELSHRSLSQILHNNHLNINSVLQLQR